MRTSREHQSRIGSLSVLILCLILPVAPGGSTARAVETSQHQTIRDDDIVMAISDQLFMSPDIPSYHVSASCHDGVVVLGGTVDNILQRERAIEIARMIRGVRTVVSEITVNPVFRPDKEIQRAISAALKDDPATEGYDVKAVVAHGVVTLTGTAQSEAEKRLARDVVMRVRGVRDVVNSIGFTPVPERSDTEISTEVRRILANDVWVDDGLVQVGVAKGNVTLTGSVGSAFEKRRATDDALLVSGVADVKNSLEVKWWLHDTMKRKEHARMTDEEIRSAILSGLQYIPRLGRFTPVVTVRSGEVRLSGVASTLAEKRAAGELAENTVGVLDVMNRIEVKPKRHQEDAELEAIIRKGIQENPVVELYMVAVNVFNGKAYLYGTVDSRLQRYAAEAIASRVPGIVAVQNHIDVGFYDPPADLEVKRNLERRLAQNALLESDSVQVRVEDSNVRLDGTVASWAERNLATREAYEAGAYRVRNNLMVRPQSYRDQSVKKEEQEGKISGGTL